MRKLLLLLILAGMSLSCIRHSAMEERARKQIVVSLEDYIESYFPGNQSWRMVDLETVYTNDSLCVLQCSVFINDSLGKQVIRDYRYIYLLDMDLSRASHKPVFAENFLNVLFVGDENTIVVTPEDVNGDFAILIHPALIDASRPVHFITPDGEVDVQVNPSEEILRESMLETGDPELAWIAEVPYSTLEEALQ